MTALKLAVLETPFRKKARTLRSPTSSTFLAKEWDDAFAEAGSTTDADIDLLNAAKWIGLESTSLRPTLNALAINGIAANQSTILAVAMVNKEFAAIEEASYQAGEYAGDSKTGPTSIEFLANLPIGSSMQGSYLTAPGATEAMIDAIPSWLFDSWNRKAGVELAGDMTPHAVEAFSAYGIRFGLSYLWNEALFEGARMIQSPEGPSWVPYDKDLSTMIRAWQARQEANFMNYPYIDMNAWKTITPEQRRRLLRQRTVIGVDKKLGRRKIRVAEPSYMSKSPPQLLIELGGLQGSYLAQFLDTALPKFPKLNCELLLRAWSVTTALAEALHRKQSTSVTLNAKGARASALLVSRNELTETFRRALNLESDEARELIQFLTFSLDRREANKGLWANPIVPIPGEDAFALVLPVLTTSNVLRKAEAWLEKGGLDDKSIKQSRGIQFENEVRSSVSSAIVENKLLTDAASSTKAIMRTKDFDEEIDLLFHVGNFLFVGEVKFHLSPADSIEVWRQFEKLDDACNQALRKADAITKRPDITAQALGISEEKASKLNAVPLVVHNQSFGFGLEMRSCRITDVRFLINILSDGSLITGGAMVPRSGDSAMHSTALYRSQQEAEERLQGILAKPFVLKRFIERIEWKTLLFPTSGGPLSINVPLLGEIRGSQYLDALGLEAKLAR